MYKWTKIPFSSAFLQKAHSYRCGVYICVLAEDFYIQFSLLIFLIFGSFKPISVS